MASAKDIAASVPPPDKLKKSGPEADPEEAAESDDEEAAELGMMDAFAEALKNGSAEERLAAFKDLLATCKSY